MTIVQNRGGVSVMFFSSTCEPSGRNSERSHALTVSGAASIILKPTLLAFGAAAIACISAESLATTTVYQYDELGRVTAAEYENVSVSYTSDAANNRTRKQSVAIVPTPITSSMTSVLVHASTGAVLTVSVAGTSPTGTVSFYDGTTFLGSAPVIGNAATIEVVDLSLGLHTITATYSGDGSNPRNSLTLSIRAVNLDWLPAVLEVLLD